MQYRRISVEFVIFPEQEEAVVADLNATLETLDEKYTIFGGAIETTPVDHSGRRRKTALRHALDAGKTATSAVHLAVQSVADACKKVV